MTERRVANCNGPNCGAEIIWCRGSRGGKVCLDVEPDSAGDWVMEDEDTPTPKAVHLTLDQRASYTGPRYQVHWATCPDREYFRRLKKRR